MARTTWELELKTRGGAGARTLTRDLKALDAALRSLGESSKVLGTIARDASALRGARVRIGAERSVGAETARQQQRARKGFDENGRARRAVEKAQARDARAASRAEIADQNERRRIGEGIARASERAAREEARAAHADAAERRRIGEGIARASAKADRDDSRAVEQAARRNAQAFARDRAMAQRQAKEAQRSTDRQSRADATALRGGLGEWKRAAAQRRNMRRREAAATAAATARFHRQAAARERETVGSIVGGLGFAFGTATAISAVTVGALSTILDMVSAVGQLTFSISSAVLEMIAFREASLTTLRAMARDGSGRRLTGAAADRQAREQFGFARSFARQTPLDVAQVIDLQRQTSAAGFTGARNRDVVRAAADVGAFNPNDPAAASHFLLGLGQLRNGSSVRTQDLRQTAQAAGLGENDILREIARQSGQTQRRGETDTAYNGRIQKMQREGRFTGAQGVEGVLAALQARNGGALGSFATAQGGTLTGTISNLKGALLDFVTGIEDIENLPGIRALKDTLNGLVDVLTGSGPTAERLRRIFTGLVNEASQFVADLGGGREGVAGLIGHVVDEVERLAPLVRDVVRAFGGGAWQAFKTALGPLLDDLTTFGDDADGTIATAGQLGTALGTLLGFGVRVTAWMVGFCADLAVGAGLILQVVDAIEGFISTIGELIASPWQDIGSLIVDGMRAGFLGPSQGFVSEVGNWSNDIENASRSALRINSPSKVFADIGSQIPAGMSLGIDSGARDVERSLSGMVAPPSLPGFGALSGLAGAGGISAVFNITVEGGASNDTGRELGEAAWSAFVDRFEQANAMAGG